MPEVDVLLKGLLSQPGAEGFLVFNDDGKLWTIIRLMKLKLFFFCLTFFFSLLYYKQYEGNLYN